MATYQVRPGYRHGKDGQYGPGDKIELSVEEAAGFLDKLELAQAPTVAELVDGLTVVAEGVIGNASTDAAGGDSLNMIEPWRGLEAKIVIALEAGGVTPAMVATLSDEELLSVAGIGPATLSKIRAAFSG